MDEQVPADEQAFYKQIGYLVRVRRQGYGLTQAQVADSVGILRTTLVNIETGYQRVSIWLLSKIARRLGTSVAEFVPTEIKTVISIDGKDVLVSPNVAESIRKAIKDAN